MGKKQSTTPSTQRKRRAVDEINEGGNGGEGRADKRAAVEVRQKLPDANKIKPLSKWILKEDAVEKLRETEDLHAFLASGRWMFENAIEGGEMTDMEFVMDSGKRIRRHKVWLMARCEYIRMMMSSGMKEARTGIVHVKECSDGAFMALLEYIYTGELGKTCLGQDWGELWDVAHLFGMPKMGDCLLAAVGMSNVEEAAAVAVERGIVDLIKVCVRGMENVAIWGFSDSEARTVIRTMDLLFQNYEATDWTPDQVEAGIRVIHEAMTQTDLEDDACMTESVCAALRAVSNRDDIDQCNMGQIVGYAINKHRTHEGVQEQAWRLLEDMGTEWLAGLMEVAMRENVEWIQQRCCRSLQRQLSSCRPPKQESGSDGEESNPKEIVCNPEEIVCAAIEARKSCLQGDLDSNYPRGPVDEMLRTFGVKNLVTAMSVYQTDVWIVERCCENLAKLLDADFERDFEDSDMHRRVMADAVNVHLAWNDGGVEAVSNAMKSHMGSAFLQANGCKALRLMHSGREALARNGDSDPEVATDFTLKNDQMYGAIMGAVGEYAGSRAQKTDDWGLVKSVTLEALSYMFKNDTVERRTEIAKLALGYIETEDRVLMPQAYSHQLACLAIWRVCRDTVEDEVRRFVVGADGVKLIVGVLLECKDDPNEVDTQDECCGALAQLCVDRDVQDLAGSCGAVQAVVDVMMCDDFTVFDDTSPAWDSATEALKRLCSGHQGNHRLAWQEAHIHGGGTVKYEDFEDWADGPDSCDESDSDESEEDRYASDQSMENSVW